MIEWPTHRQKVNPANASRQGRLSFWTSERVEILKTEWAKGEFAEEIAAIIGDGCTSNMVIGKANRLKLESHANLRRHSNERREVIRVQRETVAAA